MMRKPGAARRARRAPGGSEAAGRAMPAWEARDCRERVGARVSVRHVDR